MKKTFLRLFVIAMASVNIFTLSSCRDDLLEQTPTYLLASSQFWKTEDDATFALNGAYYDVIRCFHRDYMFDGMGEYVRFRANGGTSQSTGDRAIVYRNGTYNNPSSAGSYDNYYQYSFAAVNRCNYVIDNVNKMLETCSEASRPGLEAIVGEARMLRGLVYFRLMSFFGDVPYLDKVIESNDEVMEVERTPIKQIYDACYDDFTYAYEKLPNRSPIIGRQNKWGALALRGKMQLYWACWNRTSWPWNDTVGSNKGGWPELETFTPSQAESDNAYKAAAADFKTIIDESGMNLFRNGEPGDCGGLGDWETLPNYYYLFTPEANDSEEIMVGFAHGATGTDQGDELMRDFGTRATQGSQGWGQPRRAIMDRYQSIETGDFCTPSILGKDYKQEWAAINPKTWENRDYRMKSSIMWEGERMWCMLNLAFDKVRVYRYMTRTGVVADYDAPNEAINADADNEGTINRKFIINWAGFNRNEGYYNWPVVRLADVYLMYAEAANEAYGPQGDGGLAVELVNKVRHRGNLPALAPEKYGDKLSFFYAIEQERIIELFEEGHRWFDLRRWRSIERVWCPPQTAGGIKLYDTWGQNKNTYFNNTSFKTYQRLYIGRIPESERTKNSNLKQNPCWL